MPLNSTSIIKIVDLLCEGPIEGVVGGRKGVFLNETPLIDSSDNINYKKSEVDVQLRNGVKDQKMLPEFSSTTSNIINISEEVGQNYSEELNNQNLVKKRDYGGGQIILQITDPDTDSFQVLFTVPALFCQGMEGIGRGQFFNAKIRIKIDVKSPNSKFVTKYNKAIEGISTTNYQFKSGSIGLTGKAPFTIRIRKVVNNENDYEVQFKNFTDINKKTPLGNTRGNRVIVTSLIERQHIRTNYPYTACAGLNISTEVFSSLPSRGYLIRGSKVKIPHNATVRPDGSLKFEGTFDNKLKSSKRWTTCPVCIFYDILTNTRYGCGYFINTSNLNWVDLYPLSRYCNQLVDTPDGSEPRFAINTVIGSQTDAYKVLQNLASVFRGMTYWGSNTVNVVADHGVSQNINNTNKVHTQHEDMNPVHLYSNSNVIDGSFLYSGSSLKTRSSSVWVSYNDPENFYKPNVVVVEDYDLIEKYGYNIKEIIAFGCSSKYQAQRMGQWMLNSEKLDGNTVTFSTGLDGLAVLPSQIFAVSDEIRAGIRLSGRLKDNNTVSSVFPDVNYFTSLGGTVANEQVFLSVTLRNGTVEKKEILGITDSGKINLNSDLSTAPQKDTVYVIERSTVQTQKFRCIDVKDNNDSTYTITGLEHNDSLYDIVDNTKSNKAKLDYEDVTVHNNKPSIPEDLNVTALLVQQQTQQSTRLRFSWSRGINGANVSFIVKYRIGSGGDKVTVNTDKTTFELDNASNKKKYFFEVAAVGPAMFNSKVSTFAEFNSGSGFEVPSVNALLNVTVPTPLP